MLTKEVNLVADKYVATENAGRLVTGFLPAVRDGKLWYMYDSPESGMLEDPVSWSELTEEEYNVCIPIIDAILSAIVGLIKISII